MKDPEKSFCGKPERPGAADDMAVKNERWALNIGASAAQSNILHFGFIIHAGRVESAGAATRCGGLLLTYGSLCVTPP
jgi:hypothetical protein